VYVTSNTHFNTFEFEEYTYIPVKAKIDSGVVEINYSGGIRITDLERTVIDCIKDMDKISGMEEVLAMIKMTEHLNQKKMLLYMGEYDCQFLYQKVGYLLWSYREKLGLDYRFFEICKSKIGKSSRYLSKDISNGKYNAEWNLVVDEKMTWIKNGEADYHDSI
jgi:predicted transcriptional regulator of viral defense system